MDARIGQGRGRADVCEDRKAGCVSAGDACVWFAKMIRFSPITITGQRSESVLNKQPGITTSPLIWSMFRIKESRGCKAD